MITPLGRYSKYQNNTQWLIKRKQEVAKQGKK